MTTKFRGTVVARDQALEVVSTLITLRNDCSFINSVRPNMRLLQRAEDVGDQLLGQIINQAGLSNSKK